MKRKLFLNLTVAAIALATGVSGCKSHNPDKGITVIRGPKNTPPVNPPPIIPDPTLSGNNVRPTNPPPLENGNSLPLNPPPVPQNPPPTGPTNPTPPDGPTPLSADSIFGMIPDRSVFAQHVVYFDYDSSVVKAAFVTKINEMAVIMRGTPQNKILVEGHCDERGTEEYNRALGERRALAIRERLIKAGVPAAQIHTISYGKDKPAQMGHEDGSWSKNRRGESVMLRPPGGSANR